MKNMLKEFKEFINNGDIVTIAVGLVLSPHVQDDHRCPGRRRDRTDHRCDRR